MKMLSVEEAMKVLESVVDAVAQGEDVILTRDGTPVAQVVSMPVQSEVEREAAIQDFLADLDHKMPIGLITWTRDDLYVR